MEGCDVVGGDVVVYGVVVVAFVYFEGYVLSSVLFIFLSLLACSGLLILKWYEYIQRLLLKRFYDSSGTV